MLLGGTYWRESEFQWSPSFRVWLTGACGPNALAMLLSWCRQRYAATVDVYADMRNAGRLADQNGSSTIYGLAAQAAAYKLAPVTRGYNAGIAPLAESEWSALFIGALTHGRAILYETSNGQALRDYLTGAGENARNLHNHYIGLVGYHPGGHSDFAGRDLPRGFFALDGDNFGTAVAVQTGRLQFYTYDTIKASLPIAAISLAPLVRITPDNDGNSNGNGGAMIPAGWKDANDTLTAPNGKTVVLGFRNYVETHAWASSDEPLEEERTVNHVSRVQAPYNKVGRRQVCAQSVLGFIDNAVIELDAGAELLAAEAALDQVTAQRDDLQNQLDGAKAQIAQLEAKIAELEKSGGGSSADSDAITALLAAFAARNAK